MNTLKITTLFVLFALSFGCSSTPEFQTGPDAEVTHDGLTRLDKTVLDVVWARTDIDLTSYDKIMFEGIGVEFRPVDGPYSGRAGMGQASRASSSKSVFQLDDATKALVTEEIGGAFVEELATSAVYQVVEAPGPDVLLLRAGLLDVISRVPPETVGRSSVWLDSVGEATLVMELRDSTSNAILVRAVDRRAAERSAGNTMESNRVSNRAEVRRLGRRWASIVRSGVETLMSGE
jgi:hypothetical protein